MANKKYCLGCGRADTMERYVRHFASSHHEGVKCSHCGSLAGAVGMSRDKARNIAQMYEEHGSARDKLRKQRQKDYDAEHGAGAWDRRGDETIASMFGDSSALVDKAVGERGKRG